jgi:hypothetical protein
VTKKNTRQREFFSDYQKKLLGKEGLCRMFLTLGKEHALPSIFLYSAKTFLAECKKTLGKQIFKSKFEKF